MVVAILGTTISPYLGVLAVASDRRIMEGQPTSRLGRGVVTAAIVVMFAAAAAMLVL